MSDLIEKQQIADLASADAAEAARVAAENVELARKAQIDLATFNHA